jgi:hypothetical protein
LEALFTPHVQLDHAFLELLRRHIGHLVLDLGLTLSLIMRVVLVDESLEIPNFNCREILALNYRVKTQRVLSVLSQQILDARIIKQLVLSEPKDLESLVLSDEATLDAQALVGNLLAALVRVLFQVVDAVLLSQKSLDSAQALLCSERADEFLALLDHVGVVI